MIAHHDHFPKSSGKAPVYVAFIAALLLHAVLLVVLYFSGGIEKPERVASYTPTLKTSPAKVTFNRRQQRSSASQAISTPTVQEETGSPEIDIIEEQPIQPQVPQEVEAAGTSVEYNDLQEPVPSSTSDAGDQEEATSFSAPTGYSAPMLPDSNKRYVTGPAGGPSTVRTRKKKSKINGAELLRALKSSFNQDRATGTYSNGSNLPVQTQNGVPAHVQQRLNAWKYASYNTRLGDALYSAFNLYSKPQIFNTSVDHPISFSTLIDRTGKVLEVTITQSCGDLELDSYILDVLRKAQYAPIPKHFEVDKYLFTETVPVRVTKGQRGTLIFHRGSLDWTF